MARTYGQVGQPDPQPGGSLGRVWQPPKGMVPREVRPSKIPMMMALGFVVIVVIALTTQRDTSGGFLVALFIVMGAVALLIAVRGVVAKIRLEPDQIIHTDLIGRRRIALQQLDRPVVIRPRRRRSGGSGSPRGYELAIRTVAGGRPWLYATASFWDRRALERLADELGAPTASARTRADAEETYPGSTTWFLRRTSTQWSILLGIVLVVGLLIWQTVL